MNQFLHKVRVAILLCPGFPAVSGGLSPAMIRDHEVAPPTSTSRPKGRQRLRNCWEFFGNITTLWCQGAKIHKGGVLLQMNRTKYLTDIPVCGIPWKKPRQQNHTKPSPVKKMLYKMPPTSGQLSNHHCNAFSVSRWTFGYFAGINLATLLVSNFSSQWWIIKKILHQPKLSRKQKYKQLMSRSDL